MITRDGLGQIGKVLGFTVWQAERDYLQHLFLLLLSHEAKNELVFKGGTALQKAYGLNRASIDLDFTLNGSLGLPGLLDRIASGFAGSDYPCQVKHTAQRTGFAAALKIRGPLYDGKEQTLTTLRVEISSREKVLLEPVWKEIVPLYADLQPYTVCVMDPREILAEKVRAVMSRTKARDLYDLWFLLEKGVGVDSSLAQQKLAYYQLGWKPAEFRKRLQMKNWTAELRAVMRVVPPLPPIKRSVLEKMGGKADKSL